MALDLLVELEIVKAKVRATSRLGATKLMSQVLAMRAAALLVRSRLPRPFSRRRVSEARPSARRRVRGRVALVAAHARRRRHAVNMLLCGAPGGHRHSCSSLLTGSRCSLLMARATG